jgi:ADP-heptose:LPS heptosyltransferase
MIGAVVDPLGYELLQYCPYIDHFFVYEKRGLHRLSLWRNLHFIRSLRSHHFSHSLHFKRFWRNGFLAWAAGIAHRVGFETEGKAPYLTKTTPYIEEKNIIDLNLDLVRLLGIDSDNLSLELWMSEREKTAVDRFFRGAAIRDDAVKIVFHLGGLTSQGWPADNYAMLADRLRTRFSAVPIFLCPPTDREVVGKATGLMKGAPFVDPPHFTVLERAELIRRCDLFVGNDSGPSHMADAVGTPGVIFYHPAGDIERHLQKWKPRGQMYEALTTEQSVESCCEVCERLLAAATHRERRDETEGSDESGLVEA